MNEEEAKSWIEGHFARQARDRLERFERLFRAEAARQNLISPGTLPYLWSRHIADSAQLVGLAADDGGSWVDVGTGAGFPGLIVAQLRESPIRLVEPRGLRARFLREVAEELGLTWVEVCEARIEQVVGQASTISARAVAKVTNLLEMTTHLRAPTTALLFPRGRSGRSELESLPMRWQRLFHVEQSVTDPESVILISPGVR